jgi:hypothetical protein
MAKTFTYQDNLGNMLASSPEPFIHQLKETIYDGFEDYMRLDMADYAIYSETSPDSAPKYTMISQSQVSPNNRSAQTAESSYVFNSYTEENESSKKAEEQSLQDDMPTSGPTSVPVPDVIASKLLEQSKMSTINTVYIGSLTVIGLYVLFRYMKY